jgi:hypothetical protein
MDTSGTAAMQQAQRPGSSPALTHFILRTVGAISLIFQIEKLGHRETTFPAERSHSS